MLEAVYTVLGERKALDLHVMDRLASMRNRKTSELRFRAILSVDSSESFELARV